jgi:hypothetical protein
MDARSLRAALVAAVLCVSLGARHRSDNFIVDTPDPKLAPQIAQAAEKFRRDLAIEWLGKEMPNWAQPCVMTVQVGPTLGAGGATTFVFDHGEVFGWRMSIQGSVERIFDSVLPHEITHMIFATHFRRPLPRWADEGGATSVEGASERNKHFTMLNQFLRTGRGIPFNRMFAMKEYPPDVMPLYAQGYSLAEYLIQTGGRRKYIEFIGDGLKSDDWSGAVKRHYGIADLGALQTTWLAWVRQGFPQIKPKQDHPAMAPSTELVAAATPRRPRPEPNLVVRISSTVKDGPINDMPVNDMPKDSPAKATLLGPLVAVEHNAPSSPAGFSSPTQRLAVADTRTETRPLPTPGWRAPGAAMPAGAAIGLASASAPPSVDPFRAYVTRPQAAEPVRQMLR